MKKLSFPTVKLGNFICEVKEKIEKLKSELKLFLESLKFNLF